MADAVPVFFTKSEPTQLGLSVEPMPESNHLSLAARVFSISSIGHKGNTNVVELSRTKFSKFSGRLLRFSARRGADVIMIALVPKRR